MRKRFDLGIAGNEPVGRGMIDVRCEVAGLDLGGAAQADARPVRLALALKRDAEVVMRFGEVGPKRDGLLASGHGLPMSSTAASIRPIRGMTMPRRCSVAW